MFNGFFSIFGFVLRVCDAAWNQSWYQFCSHNTDGSVRASHPAATGSNRAFFQMKIQVLLRGVA